jgi:hypothetical protein
LWSRRPGRRLCSDACAPCWPGLSLPPAGLRVCVSHRQAGQALPGHRVIRQDPAAATRAVTAAATVLHRNPPACA